MRKIPVTSEHIKDIKKRARIMSRSSGDKTYMQCLDIVSREMMGFRHFHEAHKLAGNTTGKALSTWVKPRIRTPLYAQSLHAEYLQACQDAYFDL